MRIVILGAGGQLSCALFAALNWEGLHAGHDVVALGRRDADFLDPIGVMRAIEAQQADLVINGAAFNGIEQCAEDPVNALVVNAATPMKIANFCRRLGIPFIHFSTDYVFEGRESEAPMDEDFSTFPKSTYGWSKTVGEQAIVRVGGQSLIFRVSSLFGPKLTGPLNVIKQVMEGRGTPENPVQVLDQWTCPVSVWSVARAVAHVISGGDFPALPMIYHLAARGPIWKYQHAAAVLDRVFKDKFSIMPGQLKHPRPRLTALDSERFQSFFGYRLPTWQEDIDIAMSYLGPMERPASA